MKLPNGHLAFIDQRKLTDYALSADHEDGRHKAALFRKLCGVTANNSQILIEALRQSAASGDAVAGRTDEYGQRYSIDFPLTGPTGTAVVRAA